MAETYGISADTVRLIYVLAGFCGAPMIAVYLIQWFIYPKV